MYLTQSLHTAVQQRPDAVATVFGDRVRTVTESAERIARLAGGLRELGVRVGDRVAILALNSDRYHEYFYAVPWLGSVVNPVNIRWSPTEIGYSLRDSGSTVLLVDDAFAPILPQLREACPELATIVFIGDGPQPRDTIGYETLIAASAPVQDTRTGGSSLLALLYTGGTTGNPKGVMLSHDNLLASAIGALASGFIVTSGGVVLHAAPMFHIAAFGVWAATNLAAATHVIVPMFTPAAVQDAIERRRVTSMLLVPTMIQMLADDPSIGDHDLSSVRNFGYGASPISEAVLQRAREAFPGAGFAQAYGMTELAPIATLLSPADHDDPALLRSAGRAAAHTEVRIVDQEGAEVPRGTVGEVIVRGDNVMLGYWNLPEETSSALVDGWMHTGDGGRMDEQGYVFIVDRLKDMIITGGENVYSTEVENALASHPAVAAAAVIGLPDPEWGERVHAVLVLWSGSTVTLQEIRDHVKNSIAGYKAPRSIEVLPSLPVSGAGKILKRDLRAKHLPA